MATNEALLTQVDKLTAEVKTLRERQVRWMEAEVSDVDTVNHEIEVDVPEAEGGGVLGGIKWPAAFLPDVGDTVRLIVAGSQPMHQAGGIAIDAVTGRELAPGSVGQTNFEPLIVLGTIFVAGDPDTNHARMDPNGFTVYGYDVDTDTQYQSSQLGGPGDDELSLTNAVGESVASIDEAGYSKFQGLEVVTEPIIMGVPLGDYLEIDNVVDDWGDRSSGTASVGTTETGVFELKVVLRNDRRYLMQTSNMRMNGSTDNNLAELDIRYTSADGYESNPSQPTTLSSYFSRGFCNIVRGVAAPVPPIQRVFATPSGASGWTTYRFLFTMKIVAGAGTCSLVQTAADYIQMWFIDQGPWVDSTEQVTNDGSGGGGVTPNAVTRTKEHAASWQRTWQSDNTGIITSSEMHQGYGDSFNGNRRASAGFPTSVATDLTGATNIRIWIYMESYHWWNMSGGTMRLGHHGTSSLPATFPGHNGINNVSFTARNQGKWIEVTGWSGWVTAFQNGTARGISIGGADNSAVYYGKFRGAAYGRPRIKYTYKK